MFTGIVKGSQQIISFSKTNVSTVIVIDFGCFGSSLSQNLIEGASVSVNGTCLTVSSIKQTGETVQVFFDLIEETLKRTNLKLLKINDYVNIERSLTFGDEVGGHILSGHIDCEAKVVDIQISFQNYKVEFEFPSHNLEVLDYIHQKGYVAVNGVSLTIVDVKDLSFTVCLIPETLKRTNLRYLKIEQSVNIEVDSSSKIIVNSIKKILPRYLDLFLRNKENSLLSYLVIPDKSFILILIK